MPERLLVGNWESLNFVFPPLDVFRYVSVQVIWSDAYVGGSSLITARSGFLSAIAIMSVLLLGSFQTTYLLLVGTYPGKYKPRCEAKYRA